MGRFVVVALVLLAIVALAWKYLLNEGTPRPEGAPGAVADAGGAVGDASDRAAEAAVDDEGVEAEDRPAASADEAEPVTAAAEAEVADAAPAATVETDVDPAAVEATEFADQAADAPGEELAQALPEETVLLGEESLTAGIPGEGPLTLVEIEAWLADPNNHAVLRPELPLGLAAGAGGVKGLDANPLTRAKIELGRQLYFDPRLSVDGSVSCASCHDPDVGYASRDRFGVGVRKQTGNRNSPVAYNRILSDLQFWDGRAASLEEQAKGPIANPIEMSNTHEACVGSLREIPGYVAQFEAIFEDGLTIDNVAKAIASFERVLVTGPAPWDVYLDLKAFQDAWSVELEDLEALEEEDPELYADYLRLQAAAEESPISDSAIRGGELFFSDKSGCTACHVGANFTDELYHNLGVGMEAEEPDLGRFVVTNEEKDKGAFKTPTVRNVALTAPYMHDGSQATLAEVVAWYVKGGHPNPWLDEKVKKLELTDEEQADLVAFMAEGLAGSLPTVERERLPADAEDTDAAGGN